MRSFSLVLPVCTEDEDEYRNLMVSLNLNLVVCALKLHRYDLAKEYCNLVLKDDPKNVKALFRRAAALMNLDLPIEAHSDLVKASMLDSNNKDVVRQLGVVENLLKDGLTGKRRADNSLDSESDRKGKRVVIPLSSEGCSSMPIDGANHGGPIMSDVSVLSEVGVALIGESSTCNVSCAAPVMSAMSTNIHSDSGSKPWFSNSDDSLMDSKMASNSDLETESVISTTDNKEPTHLNNEAHEKNQTHVRHVQKSHFKFYNRKRNQFIVVPSMVHQKVIKGHQVSFYHPSSMSLMTIRIRQAATNAVHGEGPPFCTPSVNSTVTASTNNSFGVKVEGCARIVMDNFSAAHEVDTSVVKNDSINDDVVMENDDLAYVTAKGSTTSACVVPPLNTMKHTNKVNCFKFSSGVKLRFTSFKPQRQRKHSHLPRSSITSTYLRSQGSKFLQYNGKKGNHTHLFNTLWFCRHPSYPKRKSLSDNSPLGSCKKKVKFYVSSSSCSGFDSPSMM